MISTNYIYEAKYYSQKSRIYDNFHIVNSAIKKMWSYLLTTSCIFQAVYHIYALQNLLEATDL